MSKMRERKMSWGFDVPDEEVDLDRLIYEVEHVSAIKAKLYMHALWENAPHVYERLKEYCQKKGFLTWHNFEVSDWEELGGLRGGDKKKRNESSSR